MAVAQGFSAAVVRFQHWILDVIGHSEVPIIMAQLIIKIKSPWQGALRYSISTISKSWHPCQSFMDPKIQNPQSEMSISKPRFGCFKASSGAIKIHHCYWSGKVQALLFLRSRSKIDVKYCRGCRPNCRSK